MWPNISHHPRRVIAGLDPAIHDESQRSQTVRLFSLTASWMRGS
jgi:hypothetical protein